MHVNTGKSQARRALYQLNYTGPTLPFRGFYFPSERRWGQSRSCILSVGAPWSKRNMNSFGKTGFSTGPSYHNTPASQMAPCSTWEAIQWLSLANKHQGLEGLSEERSGSRSCGTLSSFICPCSQIAELLPGCQSVTIFQCRTLNTLGAAKKKGCTAEGLGGEVGSQWPWKDLI